MNCENKIERLYKYALEFQFEDFLTLLSQLENECSPQELWEGYLIRAQIKLYSSDVTFLQDFEKAGDTAKKPHFPCICTAWRTSSQNRFAVFSSESGQFPEFCAMLPQAAKLMHSWYGEDGEMAVNQLYSEICYFTGDIPHSLEIADELYKLTAKTPTDTMLNLCVLFRCHLALGNCEMAEQFMLDAINLSKNYPECTDSYQVMRTWANLTTNWSGDTPRFYKDASGTLTPCLDDRMDGIRMGIAHTPALEKPFINYATAHYDNAYLLREMYLDVFNAIYWFQAGDTASEQQYFLRFYDISISSGVVMPIIECGMQVTALLRHAKASFENISHEWIDDMLTRAEQYENSLQLYASLGE